MILIFTFHLKCFHTDVKEVDFDIDVFDGSTWQECKHNVPKLGLGEVRDIVCAPKKVKGSKVRIMIPANNKRLVLCEVEVYTLPDRGTLDLLYEK